VRGLLLGCVEDGEVERVGVVLVLSGFGRVGAQALEECLGGARGENCRGLDGAALSEGFDWELLDVAL